MPPTEPQAPSPEAAPSQPNRCAKCGAELSSANGAEKDLNQCPNCLLDLALTGVCQELSDGSDFGEFRLVRHVGRGAMGVVYEAVQTNLGRTVALKLVDANLGHSAVRRRFRIEAEAAAKLDHPNIVPVYDFGERDGQAFLSMQLIPGGNLKEKMRRGELCLAGDHGDARAIAEFMAGVARAVAHAHEHGVLHRDLKPANILVDKEDQPHLTDFGLAKILDANAEAQGSATAPGAVVGTLNYMAPEQAGAGISSKSGDVYGLGAILYEMLTGKPPFCAQSVQELIKLITQEPPKQPRAWKKSVPKDLETICLKCLEKNPAARYESANALADDLECWLKNRPIRARRAGPILRASRWCRRNPVGTALIVVLCSGLASALLVLESMQRQERESEALRNALWEQKNAELEDMWKDPARHYVLFNRAFLTRFMPHKSSAWSDPNALQLKLALEMTGDATARVADIAPFLERLEERMAAKLGQPVAFNLILQKHRPDVGDPIIKGEVDFQRLGPLAYIRAREMTNLVLLASERVSDDGVIFTRSGLGISNLAQIVGLRVGFAHTNSVVSFYAKLEMASNGITVKHLASFEHLDPAASITAPNSPGAPSGELFAHSVVINAVVTNKCDVGEARRYDFDRSYHRQKLVVIDQFPVFPKVYAAREGLDPKVAAAFQKALLSLSANKHQQVLRQFFHGAAGGFSLVTEKDLDVIRFALTNDIPKFEARD